MANNQLWHWGHAYCTYEQGVCGWLSEIFDPLLAEARIAPSCVVVVWMNCEPLHVKQHLANDTLRLIIQVLSNEKGATYLEVVPVQTHRTFLVYELVERARHVYHTLVYAADNRWSLGDFPPQKEKRLVPWPVGGERAVGNILGSCALGEKPDSPSAQQSDLAVAAETMCIRRRVRPWVRDWVPEIAARDEEESLDTAVLIGLLPDPLLDAFLFWKVREDLVAGYPRASSDCRTSAGRMVLEWWGSRSFLLISLVRAGHEGKGSEWGAVVRRLPLPDYPREKTMVLLDVLHEDGGPLCETAKRMVQLDNISNILVSSIHISISTHLSSLSLKLFSSK